MDGNESVTSLDNVFSSQPAEPIEQASVEPTQTDQTVMPQDTGEATPAPPAATPEPEHVPRTALMDERRKRQEYERQLMEAQHELERLRQSQQTKPEPLPQPALQPTQFESQEKYLEAVAEQKAAAAAQAIFEENMRRAMQAQQEAELRNQTQKDLADMLAAGKAKYGDFELVIRNPNLPLTDVMINTMIALDAGHEVGYHLGQNPAEAARISRLPPSSQAKAIAQIAKQLATPPVPEPTPAIPKTLTQTRSANGQFTKTWTGPTPLTDIFKRSS